MLLAHAWPLHMLHLVRTYTRLIGTELVYATQLDLSTESVADLLKRIVYTLVHMSSAIMVCAVFINGLNGVVEAG